MIDSVHDYPISQIFSKDANWYYYIPKYQREYTWSYSHWGTLFNDIESNALGYFIGSIICINNTHDSFQIKQLEVVDGQQRLTTLMLLLRAFYERFGKMKDENSINTRDNLALCIWKTNEFRKPVMDKLKIDSEVATDNDKDEFLKILRTGIATEEMRSKYAQNYRFFQSKINDFLIEYPTYFAYFPNRLLNNCILLPIEADNQNTALRIFSTLNDRGMPLSDADIFKAQFYKYYKSKGQKDEFITRWRALEDICGK